MRLYTLTAARRNESCVQTAQRAANNCFPSVLPARRVRVYTTIRVCHSPKLIGVVCVCVCVCCRSGCSAYANLTRNFPAGTSSGNSFYTVLSRPRKIPSRKEGARGLSQAGSERVSQKTYYVPRTATYNHTHIQSYTHTYIHMH